MSDLSDRMLTVLAPDNPVEVVKRLREISHSPGFREFSRYSFQEMQILIREAKLHFSGTTWQNPTDAVRRTTNFLQDRITSRLVEYLTMGTLVIDHSDSQDYAALFESEGFRYQVLMQAVETMSDAAARRVVQEFTGKVLAHTSYAIGFQQAPQKELGHVWDLWFHTIGTTCQALYLTGFQIQRQLREEEILLGIEIATRKKESE